MAETKKAEFARGVEQLEGTQDNFEEVLRQQPYPPTYAQTAGMTSPVANNGYPMAQPAAVMTSNINVQMPGGQAIVRESTPMPDNTWAIIHSCFIFWFFCWPLGLAAFIVAVSASNKGSASEAAAKIRTSHWISWSGLIIGVILIIVIAVAVASQS